MRRKKKGIWNNFKLLRPKNLAKEVHIYGYHFSWKRQLFLTSAALAAIAAIGVLYQLSVFLLLLVLAVSVVILPMLVLDMYKKMYEQKRFSDVTAYMEQMMYSFLKTGKIIGALKESSELFETGLMHSTLEAAVSHIEQGRSETKQGILREGLSMIEEHYACRKLQLVHNLLLHAEEYGGEVENSVMLLLEDLENWKKRNYRLQAEKKKSHTDNIISIAVATLMCAAALYVLEAMKEMFAAGSSLVIFKIGIIQVSSVLFILVSYAIFAKSSRSLTADWLAEENFHDDAYILQCYDTVAQYDRKKERKKSMLLALPFLVGMDICFLLQYWIFGGICLVVGIFILTQHQIGIKLAKKDMKQEVHLAMPQWLMEIALLLQHNNVEVAIGKSREGAPAALQNEIDALLQRTKEKPGELSVYTDFCREYDFPEVAGCMKMMHAISENGTGDVRVQMNHFIQRINEMQGAADHLRNETAALRMKLIFSYPVIAATGKLLVDLTTGMVVMFGLLGSMGGI